MEYEDYGYPIKRLRQLLPQAISIDVPTFFSIKRCVAAQFLDLKLINHPSVGSSPTQCVGSKYSRFKVSFRFLLNVAVNECIRLLVLKVVGHDFDESVNNIWFNANGLFNTGFICAFPTEVALMDYELVYDKIFVHNDTSTKFIDFSLHCDDVLDIHSNHNQYLYLFVGQNTTDIFAEIFSTYWGQAETHFIG